jgi:hypothetical protein
MKPEDFIDRQMEASDKLFKVMFEDHKERMKDMVLWADMNSGLMKKLDERDETIARLTAELTALKAASGL